MRDGLPGGPRVFRWAQHGDEVKFTGLTQTLSQVFKRSNRESQSNFWANLGVLGQLNFIGFQVDGGCAACEPRAGFGDIVLRPAAATLAVGGQASFTPPCLLCMENPQWYMQVYRGA